MKLVDLRGRQKLLTFFLITFLVFIAVILVTIPLLLVITTGIYDGRVVPFTIGVSVIVAFLIGVIASIIAYRFIWNFLNIDFSLESDRIWINGSTLHNRLEKVEVTIGKFILRRRYISGSGSGSGGRYVYEIETLKTYKQVSISPGRNESIEYGSLDLPKYEKRSNSIVFPAIRINQGKKDIWIAISPAPIVFYYSRKFSQSLWIVFRRMSKVNKTLQDFC